MRLRFKALLALAATVAAPVQAKSNWLEVRSEHFIVDVDTDEAQARVYAEHLERFDAALRRLYGVAENPERRSNPLHIFALHPDMFQEVCECGAAVGYYLPDASGSTIFAGYLPDLDAKAKPGSMSPQSILLHEYSHHFMYSNFPRAYPMWYSEGFAEFNANVIFNPDGSLTLGLPADYRYEALHDDEVQLSVQDLFEPGGGMWLGAIEVLYGRGWLLTHFLTLDPKRKGQLAVYLDQLNHGKSSIEAGKIAFGDLNALYKDLYAYLHGPKLAAPLLIPASTKPIALTVSHLGAGVAELIETHAHLVSGASPHARDRLAREAERIAARYTADGTVQRWAAEADWAADDLDAADAAADRALALAPNDIDTLLLKGVVAVRRAFKAKSTDAAVWKAARGWYLRANRLDPNRALPFVLYYQSFGAAKEAPSANAITGLKRAEVLAPEDATTRLLLARQFLAEGDALTASLLLQPIAYAPHGGKADTPARIVVNLIAAGKIDEAKKAMDKVKIADATTRD